VPIVLEPAIQSGFSDTEYRHHYAKLVNEKWSNGAAGQPAKRATAPMWVHLEGVDCQCVMDQ
jgi:hypothetical protein